MSLLSLEVHRVHWLFSVDLNILKPGIAVLDDVAGFLLTAFTTFTVLAHDLVGLAGELVPAVGNLFDVAVFLEVTQ